MDFPEDNRTKIRLLIILIIFMIGITCLMLYQYRIIGKHFPCSIAINETNTTDKCSKYNISHFKLQ